MWWLMLLWLQNNANANTKKTIRKALSVILALFCKFFKKLCVLWPCRRSRFVI